MKLEFKLLKKLQGQDRIIGVGTALQAERSSIPFLA
jgi:hypothetical protein